MTPQGRKRTIDLFGEHGSCQLVWKSHGRKRKRSIRSPGPTRRQSVMSADDEDEIAALHFRPRDKANESGRVHGFASRIEQNLAGSRMTVPGIPSIRADFAHLDRTVAAGADQKLFGQRIGVGVLRFANEIEIDLHSGGISTFLALRQRRSRS